MNKYLDYKIDRRQNVGKIEKFRVKVTDKHILQRKQVTIFSPNKTVK